MKKLLSIALLLILFTKVDFQFKGIPDWEFKEFNSILKHDKAGHNFILDVNTEIQHETWWITHTSLEVLKAVNEKKRIPEKRDIKIVLMANEYKPEELFSFLAVTLIMENKRLIKIALIQPIIPAGKSLGIAKAPESIQVLAGQLKHLGYEVRMYHSPSNDELYAKINEFQPDYIGISTMTPNYPEGRKIAEKIKKNNSQVPIILGGWHASGCIQAHLLGQESESLKELLNDSSPFDFVISGEGEDNLPKLINDLEKGLSIEATNGINFYKDGLLHISSTIGKINNLSDIALPSWDGLTINEYRDKRSGALDLSVHFNRGCRFDCGYCSTPVVYGKGIRTTPAPMAIEYIKYLIENHNPQVITFTDEDFFAKQKWVEELVNLIRQEDFHGKYGITFDTFASINDLYRLQKNNQGEFMDQMKTAGFSSFTIGIESFNPNVLYKYNKEKMILATMEQAEREIYDKANNNEKKKIILNHYYTRAQEAVNFAHSHGILVVGDYMIGNIGENQTEVRKGFEMFKNIQNLLVAYMPIFTPFPGTAIWAEVYNSGLLPKTNQGTTDWEKFNANAGVLNVDYDLEFMRNELEIDFYTSSRYANDMMIAISNNPNIKGLFLGRFNYLNRVFSGVERIEKNLNYLKNV